MGAAHIGVDRIVAHGEIGLCEDALHFDFPIQLNLFGIEGLIRAGCRIFAEALLFSCVRRGQRAAVDNDDDLLLLDRFSRFIQFFVFALFAAVLMSSGSSSFIFFRNRSFL